MTSDISNERKDRLCRELRDLTQATNARYLSCRKWRGRTQHIFTGSVTLAGVNLQYFYGFNDPSNWRRFHFEGNVEEFEKKLAVETEERAVLERARANGETQNLSQHNLSYSYMWYDDDDLLERGRPVEASSSITRPASSERAARSAGSRYLRLPRELRDMIHIEALSSAFVLYRYSKDQRKLLRSFVCDTDLCNTNQQLRAQSLDTLRAAERALPVVYLVPADADLDWSAIPTGSHPKICVEFSSPPTLDGPVESFFDAFRNGHAGFKDRDLTLIFNTTSVDDFYMDESSFADGIEIQQSRLRAIVKQDLMVEGKRKSGFATYYRIGMYSKIQHCLRSDDLVGYLNLLLDFDRPTAGEHVLRTLCWDSDALSQISPKEQEALQKALPAPSVNDLGWWITRDMKD